MSAAHPTDGRLAGLLETLRILAADAVAQAEYLARLGLPDSADELALELHDAVVLLGQLVDDCVMSEEAAEAVLAVDRKLNEMSGERKASLWTREALERSSYWDEVRQLATVALAALEKKTRVGRA